MRVRDLAQSLTVGTQLRLGLGVILILVVLLGGVAWQQADSLWQKTQMLYEHPLEVRRAVDQIALDILTMQRGLTDAVLAENDREIEQAEQIIDRHEADAHRQFTVLYDRYLGARSDIEAVERIFVEWGAIRDEELRLLRAGRVAEAARISMPTGGGGRQVDLMLAALGVVSDFATAKADQFYLVARSERDTLQTRLLGALEASG